MKKNTMKLYSDFVKKEVHVMVTAVRVDDKGHPKCLLCRSVEPVANTEHGYVYFVLSAYCIVDSEQLIPEYAREQFKKF